VAVTKAMESILGSASEGQREPVIPTGWDDRQQRAIVALYEARHGVAARNERQQISAIERKHRLEHALAFLRPLLAQATSPEFREFRAITDELEVKLGALREEIAQKLLIQDPWTAAQLDKQKDKPDEGDGSDDRGDGKAPTRG
jgi:hypothetical protein